MLSVCLMIFDKEAMRMALGTVLTFQPGEQASSTGPKMSNGSNANICLSIYPLIGRIMRDVITRCNQRFHIACDHDQPP